ncbi:MAG: retropepsin-like aspartic protease [Synechococcaceae cyanobacterium]
MPKAALPLLITTLWAAPASAALLQLSGAPLRGGHLRGSLDLPLERAAAGETPVLTFTVGRGVEGMVAGTSRGMAGGQPLRLLLDTGATMTMLLPAAAARLGLRPQAEGEAPVTLAGGGVGCAQLRPRRLALPLLRLTGLTPADGELRLEGAEALVLPVAALPQGVDGVLGVASLRQLPFAIDPKAGWLRFGSRAIQPSQGVAAAAKSLPLRWKRGLPLLYLQGPRGPLPALADTGAEGLFLAPDRQGDLTPLGPGEQITLVGICGAQPVTRLPALGVGLPGAGSSAAAVIVTPNPIFQQLGVKAILGQELLSRYRQLWRLDLASPRLELR